jgi:hypothetical protein
LVSLPRPTLSRHGVIRTGIDGMLHRLQTTVHAMGKSGACRRLDSRLARTIAGHRRSTPVNSAIGTAPTGSSSPWKPTDVTSTISERARQ